MTTIIWDDCEQGSAGWKAIRAGRITGSKARLARQHSDGLTDQQRTYIAARLRGAPEAEALTLAGYKRAPSSDAVRMALEGQPLPQVWSDAALAYASDLAREQLGGRVPDGYQTPAMRLGSAEEAAAVAEWEALTGRFAEVAGFAYTPDGRFGYSPDRLVGTDGMLEVKTMFSSATLWRAVVEGDIDEYRDQVLMGLWLLHRRWCDLCLWVPDLQILRVIRIERNDDEIEALVSDLVTFSRLVEQRRDAMERMLDSVRAGVAARAPASVADMTLEDLDARIAAMREARAADDDAELARLLDESDRRHMACAAAGVEVLPAGEETS